MEITLNKKGTFVARSDYSDRKALKEAGFTWSNLVGGHWATSEVEVASKLKTYCSPEAVEKIEKELKEKEEVVALSKATTSDKNYPCPPNLEYLPFQSACIEYALSKKHCLIADEMGLGKTIEALGVANAMNAKKILIVCPASLKTNWKEESEKWIVDDLKISVIGPKNKNFDSEIVIINFDILHKFKKEIDEIEFDLLIVDEVHKCKNRKSRRTKMILGEVKQKNGEWIWKVKPISATKILFLTGTPILNRPAELYPILCSISTRFRGWKRFHVRYCDAKQGRFGWDTSGSSNLDELNTKLREEVMIRRLKEDVLPNLPEKTRTIVELSKKGQSKIQKSLKKLNWEEVAEKMKAGEAGFKEISKLRKEEALKKLPQIIEFVKDVMEKKEKIVIFAIHHEVIDALMSELSEFNSVKLDGRDSLEARDKAVKTFQNDNCCRIFIGNIHAAGVGLTLTASSTVVFAEVDWVPGNIFQAEDRCHRIGQKNAVQVFYLVIEESLDITMLKKTVMKKAIIFQALDKEVKKEIKEITKIKNIAKNINIAKKEVTEKISKFRKELSFFDSLTQNQAITAKKLLKKHSVQIAKKEVKEEIEEISKEEIQKILYSLRQLARVCDGAENKDGKGFNAFDSKFGKELSFLDFLTQNQAIAAKKLLKKYSVQLKKEVKEEIEEIELPFTKQVFSSKKKKLSFIMKRAWEIRREASEKFQMNIMEIHFGECLKIAWAEVT